MSLQFGQLQQWWGLKWNMCEENYFSCCLLNKGMISATWIKWNSNHRTYSFPTVGVVSIGSWTITSCCFLNFRAATAFVIFSPGSCLSLLKTDTQKNTKLLKEGRTMKCYRLVFLADEQDGGLNSLIIPPPEMFPLWSTIFRFLQNAMLVLHN